MSRRQSIAERARNLDASAVAETEDLDDRSEPAASGTDHMFRSSRPLAESATVSAGDASDIDLRDDDAGVDAGPSSRPNRRREIAEEEEPIEGDKFPWHFQFDDDEPEELQASSPLLSRAFRATIG